MFKGWGTRRFGYDLELSLDPAQRPSCRQCCLKKAIQPLAVVVPGQDWQVCGMLLLLEQDGQVSLLAESGQADQAFE
jgi:hypothetical protein